MTETIQTPTEQWPLKRAMILSAAFLVVGIAGGWSIRGWESPQPATPANAAVATGEAQSAGTSPDPARLKQAADAEAAPMLENLKGDPRNADLLTSLGNLYYDARQYPTAIDFYGRVLAVKPSDVNVRTDMGTAYWYLGNTDSAIEEFDQALAYAPDNPNTLLNRGLVKWQGKKDGPGALSDWEKLLAANPNYDGREKVEQMMTEVKTKSGSANPARPN